MPQWGGPDQDTATARTVPVDEAGRDGALVAAARSGGALVDEARIQAERRRARERLRQQDRLETLEASGWHGLAYEAFEADLVGYGQGVLTGWQYTGRIYRECARIGRPLESTEASRTLLRASADDRLELAGETIARALPFFRERSLIGHAWKADRGARIETFFTGSLIQRYPTVYRRWLRDLHRWEHDLAIWQGMPSRPVNDGPEASAVFWLAFRAWLAQIKNLKTRQMVALAAAEMTTAEIGVLTGEAEHVVAQRLYRARRRIKAYRKEIDAPSHEWDPEDRGGSGR